MPNAEGSGASLVGVLVPGATHLLRSAHSRFFPCRLLVGSARGTIGGSFFSLVYFSGIPVPRGRRSGIAPGTIKVKGRRS